MKANNPIGIFDSGIGGLTVAKALVTALPSESIIYFGDTAHLPYGDKSANVIQGYTKGITDFLLEQKVKLILIACNSASAAAHKMLQNHIGSRALLVNVVDPVVNFLGKNYMGECVGLIGTDLTIDSGIYSKKLAKLKCNIDLRTLATPLLAPFIEKGLFEHQHMDVTLLEYLLNPVFNGIKALVLGCTHYSVIKSKIANFYQRKEAKIEIIDSAKIVATEIKHILYSQKLLAAATPKRHFYVSNYTENFAHKAKLFFGKEVIVEALKVF